MFATPTFHKVLSVGPVGTDARSHPTAGGGPVGLDASGGWLAEIYSDGDLMSLPGTDDGRRFVEPDVVASEVASALWHDTDPGRLAVLTCPPNHHRRLPPFTPSTLPAAVLNLSSSGLSTRAVRGRRHVPGRVGGRRCVPGPVE